jgi:type I restriction enzyme S subunit
MFGDLSINSRAWPVHRFGDVVAGFETGKSIAAAPDDTAGGLRVLKVSAVTSRTYRASESKPVPVGYQPPLGHYVRDGDLLMSRANTTELVGACAFVFSTPENRLLPDKLWRFVWTEPRVVEPLYIWRAVQDPRIRKAIEDRATGSSGSMKNISQKKFLSIDVPIPPVDLQREFTARLLGVRHLDDLGSESLSEIEVLIASLQQRAFRGEL